MPTPTPSAPAKSRGCIGSASRSAPRTSPKIGLRKNQALAALVATDALPQAQIERGRLLLWGLPAAAMVMAAVSLEPWIRARRWRLARLLGDASYSIYLSPGFVLPVIGIAAVKTGLHGIVGMTAGFALSVAASAAFGIATYLWVERPMTLHLMRGRRSRARGTASVG